MKWWKKNRLDLARSGMRLGLIVAAFRLAVPGKVLYRSDDRIRSGEVVTLQTAHKTRSKCRNQKGVLSQSLFDSRPSEFSCDIEDRPVADVRSGRFRFLRNCM